jgi:hypothetical protein
MARKTARRLVWRRAGREEILLGTRAHVARNSLKPKDKFSHEITRKIPVHGRSTGLILPRPSSE